MYMLYISKYIYKSKTKYQLASYFWSTLFFLDNFFENSRASNGI